MTGYPMVFCLALESVNHLWEFMFQFIANDLWNKKARDISYEL